MDDQLEDIKLKIKTDLWDKESAMFKRVVNAAAYYGCTYGVLKNKMAIKGDDANLFDVLKTLESYGVISIEKYKHKRNMTEVIRVNGFLRQKIQTNDNNARKLWLMNVGESVVIDARVEKIGEPSLALITVPFASGMYSVSMGNIGFVEIKRIK